MSASRACRRLAACLAAATLAAPAAVAGQEDAGDAGDADRALLLELHAEQREAHLAKDPELLLRQFADEFRMIADGDVATPTRDESRQRFARYFGRVEFLEWDDAEPPIVRVSGDGTLAHVIVQKRVRLTTADDAGRPVEEAVRFAWLATYEKRAGDWRLTAVASTERPEEVEATPASAAAAPASCAADTLHAQLDFWLGEWDVRVGGRSVGTNRIEKVLAGCAVVEHWADAEGGRGMSLFYVPPGSRTWKQVWVTERATVPGGAKEKLRVDAGAPGAVRFQGEIPLPDGGSYLDRTTLTPAADGSVRQVIEVSRDEGKTWQTGFDAVYVKKDENSTEKP